MKVEVYFPLLLQQMLQKWGGGSKLLDFFYPVGTYYETSNASFNPNTTWGGTWVEDSKGFVTIGADVNGDAGLTQAGLLSVNVNEKVGEAKHTLSVTEIPSHYHYVHMSAGGSGTGSDYANGYTGKDHSSAFVPEKNSVYSSTSAIGNNQAHNNTQPSIGVRRWHRTA